jgi:hypothetical protein
MFPGVALMIRSSPFCHCALSDAMGWVGKGALTLGKYGEGGTPPIAMERVRKRLKTEGLRRSIVQKSPEAVGNKGVK